MRTLKLYAAVTTTANAIQNVMVPQGGHIKSLRYAIHYDGPADNASLAIELSASSVAVLGQNDIPAIDEVRMFSNLTTSGAFLGQYNLQRFINYPVRPGDRIYLHAIVAGTVGAAVTIHIDIE